MGDFDVRPVSEIEPAAVLAAINEAFGRHLSLDWYRWKHVDGPWGPSRGWVAVDGAGVVGTRLIVPWRLHSEVGEHDCGRAMDGATVPRARRRGIFSALVRAEMRHIATSEQWSCLYSTSVPASREAYRGLGWTILPDTTSSYLPVPPGRRHGVQITDEIVGPVVPADGRLQTDWSASALRWRTDPRSGRSYECATLAETDRPQGLVFRCFTRGRVRVLSVVHAWGASVDQRRLVLGAARTKGAAAVLQTSGPATARPLAAPGWRVRGSTVSVWVHAAPAGRPVATATQPRSWSFSAADLEGVL